MRTARGPRLLVWLAVGLAHLPARSGAAVGAHTRLSALARCGAARTPRAVLRAAPRARVRLAGADSDRSAKGQRISFGSKGSAIVPVDDHGAPTERPLEAYMCLPPEEWVEIDARLITRVPIDDAQRGNAAAGAQRYRLALPLRLGPELVVQASCTVDVRVDLPSCTLRIAGTNATLTVVDAPDAAAARGGGEPAPASAHGAPRGAAVAADAADAVSSASASARSAEQQAQVSAALRGARLEVAFEATAHWTPARRSPEPAQPSAWLAWAPLGRAQPERNGSLELGAQTTVALTLPGAVSRVPPFLLTSSGSMALRALTAALLPQFGRLVAADYRAWSRGLERTGGKLLASLGGARAGDAAEPGGGGADGGRETARRPPLDS
ncbi:hypothetical protein KFE25_011791 [Diacronema lutheri]|uniref:Uncharacterized protein n=1 Tax=Diacronema lutheri TaxID=2081491 RepID=A0A8J5XKB9_DIALT|nr:hypothetical protein KFE25_011791 [Diacronema lutheri]